MEVGPVLAIHHVLRCGSEEQRKKHTEKKEETSLLITKSLAWDIIISPYTSNSNLYQLIKLIFPKAMTIYIE